jgi:hypothetical protein
LIGIKGEFMKVVDFIKELERLGYTEETELSFGFINGEQGEYYECEVMSIDDEDRQCGEDVLIVEFEKPEEYIKSEVEITNIELREDLLEVVNRYL